VPHEIVRQLRPQQPGVVAIDHRGAGRKPGDDGVEACEPLLVPGDVGGTPGLTAHLQLAVMAGNPELGSEDRVNACIRVHVILRQAHQLLVAALRRRRQGKDEEQRRSQAAGRHSLHDPPARNSAAQAQAL
jgi:hypothetical protein